MSRSLNRVEILGYLGQDAEVKYTPNGAQVARVSVGTTRRWKDQKTNELKEATEWHRVVVWNCEKVISYLTKGKQVFIEGRLQTRNWEKDGQKHYSTEIVSENLILLGGGQGQGQNQQQHSGGRPPAASNDSIPSDQGISDDDVPF